MRMIRGEGGVTLIEVAVVMAIVGIMALFMAPALGEWLENYRIRQGTREIVSNLQLAKMRAISSRMEYRVKFNLDNEQYWLEKNDGVWTKEGDDFHMPRGVYIDSTTGLGSPPTPTVEFNPDGTSSNGTITINNVKGKQYDVIISRTGRIRMQEV